MALFLFTAFLMFFAFSFVGGSSTPVGTLNATAASELTTDIQELKAEIDSAQARLTALEAELVVHEPDTLELPLVTAFCLVPPLHMFLQLKGALS